MTTQRPNILFIMSDDHAANAISVYGSRLAKVFKTPNIDRLAREGALLKNCHCTNAICTPSRATIITGLHSHKNGVKTLNDEYDYRAPTYPEMMKEAGYSTAVVGKWHLHCEPRGFDYYDTLPGHGHYFNTAFMSKENSPDWKKRGDALGAQGTQHTGYVTDLITDKCLNFLETRDKSKPFMLMCHHKAPHDPWHYHPRHEHIFDGIDIPEPESLWEDKSHRSEATRSFGATISNSNKPEKSMITHLSKPDWHTGALNVEGLSPEEQTKAAYQKFLKDYLRTVAAVDESVGSLLDYLDENGLAENTIVIYTSDQGFFLGEHDYWDKRWIYEESLQMPFIARYPVEIPAGTICDNVINNADFAPLLLDYAGLSAADGMQGVSFRHLLRGEKDEGWKDELYYRYWMHMNHHENPAHYGIRTKEHKLIFFYGLPLGSTGAQREPTPPGWELYDLVNDPFELRNVYGDPEYARITDELKKRLIELKDELEDPDVPEVLERLAMCN